jgi:hypothetical protein
MFSVYVIVVLAGDEKQTTAMARRKAGRRTRFSR